MTVESVTFISDLDVSNPSGGDSISQGDDHLRNIKKSLKETFPNITEQVTATAEDLNKMSGFAATGNGVFASVKYNGATATVMYGHNISGVTIINNGQIRVNFVQPTDGFDHHYAVQLTPIASNNKPVIAMVNDQRASYCEFSVKEETNGQWLTPVAPIGFYMTMVDMIQTEANANT